MKRQFLLACLVTSVGLVIIVVVRSVPVHRRASNTVPGVNTPINPIVNQPTLSNTNPIVNAYMVPVPAHTATEPIRDFFSRVTKKPFGLYVTPTNSPVQPEKFTGYHTGADAETTLAEVKTDVPIMSIAAGTVVFAGHVNGYGGVIVIKHSIDGVKLLSLYGHLRIASFTVKVGDTTKLGQRIGLLGTGYSTETDGERKHLHFGLIKSTTITYRGYVASSSQLSGWYDPVAWLRSRGW